jgi:bifunctional enzyme CysN/CysC
MNEVVQQHPFRRLEADRSGELAPAVDLLRLTTAGSVDDGKSTLIGRLLYDTKSIFEDQLEAIESASRRRGEGYLNLALLTDGLRAEREQNITIDVAYRYFATPRRKFIIADTPGHVQYTRNMVTGASTAELAIVLVDARKGVQTQSRRHGYIASLLRIPHLLVAINKMDLVDYDQEVYESIVEEYRDFADQLDLHNVTFIPVSALQGDNVVQPSTRMEWYRGGTLLHHLETVDLHSTSGSPDLRFPVQYVVRPHQDYRGLAGRVASGTVRAGDAVVVLPSGQSSRVRAVETADGPLAHAGAGASVVVTLEDELDVSRGDMVVSAANRPAVANRFSATICWMAEKPLDPATPYVLMQTSRQVRAFVSAVDFRVDVDTLEEEVTDSLGWNEIGVVQLTSSEPIFFDRYDRNRITGSFILVDPHSNGTVAAGMIRGDRPQERAAESVRDRAVSPHVVWESAGIGRGEWEARQGHGAAALWFTGLSGAGKSTIARALERRLFDLGYRTALLDGDQLRHGLCGDLGFAEGDRRENLRRAGEVARLFFESGTIVLCAFVSPYREDRQRVRSLFPSDRFLEIHVDADLETCQARDPKGLYARAAAGEIRGFTGIDAPYEAPTDAEIRLDTRALGVDAAVDQLIERLRREAIIPA